MIFSFPGWREKLVYSPLHYQTWYRLLCINSAEVTVTLSHVQVCLQCTYGIITGGQGFMAVSKQSSSSGYALRLCLFTAINPWHCAITITKLRHLAIIGSLCYGIVSKVYKSIKAIGTNWCAGINMLRCTKPHQELGCSALFSGLPSLQFLVWDDRGSSLVPRFPRNANIYTVEEPGINYVQASVCMIFDPQ